MSVFLGRTPQVARVIVHRKPEIPQVARVMGVLNDLVVFQANFWFKMIFAHLGKILSGVFKRRAPRWNTTFEKEGCPFVAGQKD